MNAPAGRKRSMEEFASEIRAWLDDFCEPISDVGRYRCRSCKTRIYQTTLYISVHDPMFRDCAGSGEVKTLGLPYCPKCEPQLERATLRSCVHMVDL